MADWRTFVENVRHRLSRQARVTMTIDEIIDATASRDAAIRKRWYWRAAQRGSRDYEGFSNAGVRLELVPDERGREVERVTFYR